MENNKCDYCGGTIKGEKVKLVHKKCKKAYSYIIDAELVEAGIDNSDNEPSKV